MSWLGRSLRSGAIPSLRQQCPRRALSTFEIVSRASSLVNGWDSRSFSSSVSRLIQRSPTVGHPRWINSKPRAGDEADEEDKKALDEAEEAEEIEEAKIRLSSSDDESPSNSSSAESAPPSSSDSTPPSSSSSGGNKPPSSSSRQSGTIARQSVPEVYPQVLALPIVRRPLFPGFYKAVVVRDPHVVAAIKDMMKRGQPYLGAFLLKDEHSDSDVITNLDSVHPVGVFAQITSVFSANPQDEKEEGLTAVLYPHRRIRITSLLKAGGSANATVETVGPETVDEESQLLTPPPSPVLEDGISGTNMCYLHYRL